MPSMTEAINWPPVIKRLLSVTRRPLMSDGAVSAIYTGTVTDAPPVHNQMAKI